MKMSIQQIQQFKSKAIQNSIQKRMNELCDFIAKTDFSYAAYDSSIGDAIDELNQLWAMLQTERFKTEPI